MSLNEEHLQTLVNAYRIACAIESGVANQVRIESSGNTVLPNLRSVNHLIDQASSNNPEFSELSETDQAWVKDVLRKNFLSAQTSFYPASKPPSHKTSTPQTVLMTPPSYYASGNDIFNRLGDYAIWSQLRGTLENLGVEVKVPETETLPLPTEVYTRDSYAVIGNIAYFPDPSLQAEGLRNMLCMESDITHRLKNTARVYLEEQGVNTVIVESVFFEGGNVLIDEEKRVVFLGEDETSAPKDSEKLINTINSTQPHPYQLVRIPLVQTSRSNFEDAIYHLDLGMSPSLPNGKRFICPDMTDPETFEQVMKILGEDNVVKIGFEDAINMGTNFIVVGNTIIMSSETPNIANKIKEMGYQVVDPSSTRWDDSIREQKFAFGLGGVHCMVNDVPPRSRQPS